MSETHDEKNDKHSLVSVRMLKDDLYRLDIERTRLCVTAGIRISRNAFIMKIIKEFLDGTKEKKQA